MTIEDFIKKTLPLIKSATSIPDFIDIKTAFLVQSVVDQLAAANVFQILIQSDSSLRNDYI